MDDNHMPDGYKVEISETRGDNDRWAVELLFKNGYYWVQSRNGSKTFQRFFQERDVAWRCYYERCDLMRATDEI